MRDSIWGTVDHDRGESNCKPTKKLGMAEDFEFRMPEDAVILSMKDYQDLTNAAQPSLYQKALGEIIALIIKIEPEGEIAKGASDILTFHQIHLKPI
ncbi:MAG TPA: hypothetical protein VGQ51_13260 [Puia sp.]|jgi:hypothetical protein|nr:hypothetical protein [Puia sp.]